CLELMATDAIVAIQDMGAAGLTSSSVEMASKGGVGVELNLDLVPARETAMTAYELMLSESQERMLMVLKPNSEEMARAIFDKWELDFAIIGKITDSGNLVLKMDGETKADIPVNPLVENSPEYDRPWERTPEAPQIQAKELSPPKDLADVLLKLVSSPDTASKRWVWEQYDHMVMANTVAGPGADSAIVRIQGTNRGLAVTTDCTPRYCVAAPETGGQQAAAEAWRNLTAVGAKPLALTNNLNFGNPERPVIMGQFVGCVAGIGEAGRVLDFPVVSGNVSLYNETNGEAILPTPVIGGVGLIDNLDRTANCAFKAKGDTIILIGNTTGWLGASMYLREAEGREDGAPPPVDLATERKNGDFVRGLISSGQIDTCHDISDGGLLVAIAEMAMAGGIGAEITSPETDIPLFAWAFGEDQARYVITSNKSETILNTAQSAGISARIIGVVGGAALTLGDSILISLSELVKRHRDWLPNYMANTDA
ncbi:AIR synthase-related protein, partial [Alphaproteobacteria bacterium]|nr:AIR synthase-related protein [Alphaproteobacteria bacterium]